MKRLVRFLVTFALGAAVATLTLVLVEAQAILDDDEEAWDV